MPESNEENLNDETLAGPEREEEAQETSRDGQPVVADDPALEPGSPEDDEKLLGFPVVAMGASAGGLEAYFDIFDTLRPDTGMAFVVLSHLAPDRRSYLAEILSRRTSMPVVEIGNREEPAPNHVYVVTPGSHVTIRDGAFVVDSSQRPRYPRVIDNFFFSLASDQKSRAIGVLLSGLDSDGALGLKAIRGEGGIAIVQEPATAPYSDMPRSGIAADHVDFILPPNQIGYELDRLAKQFFSPHVQPLEKAEPMPEKERVLTRILAMLKSASGIDFRQYKSSTIQRRIARRMMLAKQETLADYLRLLQSNPGEVRELYEDALINVTRFFRDPSVFEAIRHEILPRLLAGRSAENPVRVWVAGCSTGEEAYSVGICLLEYLTGHIFEPSIQIFATDASERSIDKARAGIYPETIISDVSPERLRRFFVKVDRGYQVSKRVRDMCVFARQNLCSDPPFSKLDLISCRNVLIYIGAPLQRSIISTFHYALKTEGYLVLGTSETIREYSDLFRLMDRKRKLYSKIGTSTPISSEVASQYTWPHIPEIFPKSRNGKEAVTELELQRSADRTVLARFGPPGVVINREMHVIQVRGHTAPYLEMAPGTASFQLLRMLREDISARLRDVVQRAIQEDLPLQVSIPHPDADGENSITVEILPLRTVQENITEHFLVLFVEKPGISGPEPYASHLKIPESTDEKEREILQLRQDLVSTKIYLQSLIEERDAKNQELLSANEELQSSGEEMQSINEELETAKEELQSANEELQTVNEELQTRNAELSHSTNDLTNLLNSVNFPVIMLDSQLCIRHFTPLTERLLNIRTADIGRPIEEIRLNLQTDDLQPILREVLDTLGTREMDVRDRQNKWYLLRARPYRTAENKIEGVVIVLVDVDQQRRNQHSLEEALAFSAGVIEAVPIPLAVLKTNLQIDTVNSAFRKLSGLPKDELQGRLFSDLATSLWSMPEAGERLHTLLATLNRGSSVLEMEHRTPEGNYLHVLACVLQMDGSETVLVSLEDVTATRLLEEEQNQEKQRLRGQVEQTTRALRQTRDELRTLARGLIVTQEEERRRVARELHDDLSQKLALIEIMADAVLKDQENSESMRRELAGLREKIQALSADIRRISHQLHPSVLEDLGLPLALEQLVEEFGRSENMPAEFFTQNVSSRPSSSAATTFYRIAQEALRNVAKYAGRTHVKVTLAETSDQLRLTIRDFGQGFDVEETKQRSGLGLLSMSERARLMQGTFHVSSGLGEGTSVEVAVPKSALSE